MKTPLHNSQAAFANAPGIDWINLALGVCLAFSPWVALGNSYDALLNAFVCGTVVAVAAAVALIRPNAWSERLIMTIGVWLLVAPWLLGFLNSNIDAGISFLAGFPIASLASFKVSPMSRSAQR